MLTDKQLAAMTARTDEDVQALLAYVAYLRQQLNEERFAVEALGGSLRVAEGGRDTARKDLLHLQERLNAAIRSIQVREETYSDRLDRIRENHRLEIAEYKRELSKIDDETAEFNAGYEACHQGLPIEAEPDDLAFDVWRHGWIVANYERTQAELADLRRQLAEAQARNDELEAQAHLRGWCDDPGELATLRRQLAEAQAKCEQMESFCAVHTEEDDTAEDTMLVESGLLGELVAEVEHGNSTLVPTTGVEYIALKFECDELRWQRNVAIAELADLRRQLAETQRANWQLEQDGQAAREEAADLRRQLAECQAKLASIPSAAIRRSFYTGYSSDAQVEEDEIAIAAWLEVQP